MRLINAEKRVTKVTICVALLLSFILVSKGQTSSIDALKTRLEKHTQIDTAKVNLLNTLAYEIRLHDPKQSVFYAQQSLDLSTGLKYRKGEATSLWISGITIRRSDKEAGLENFRKALQIAEEIDDKEGQCNYLIAIGNAVRSGGDVKASDQSYTRALRLAKSLNDKTLIIKVLINSARNRSRNGNHAQAIHELEEVIRLSKQIDKKEIIARAYADLGAIYNIQGNYPLSIEYHLKSLALNEERNDYIGVYDNSINIANIQSGQNDFEAALKTITKAQKLATEKEDSSRMSVCFNYLGNMYRRINRPEALGFFQQSLAMYKFNRLSENIDNLINIGSIYTDRGEFKKATTNLDQALALAQQADIKRLFGDVYAKKGLLYFKQKQYDQANEQTQKALIYAQESHSMELQRECNKLLSDIFAATGNFRDAYDRHVVYKRLYDSIYNEKDTRKTALLESAHEFAKERAVYELEKTTRELRIKGQQQAIVSLVVIALLVLLLSVAIYWSNRLRKMVLKLEIEKKNQEIEENQKAMAVAKLKLVQNSERDTHNVKVLEHIEKNAAKNGETIGSLISNYKVQSNQSNWEEFETLFTKVNASFWDKLNDLYPTLTPNERKLCVFLKLNMSNKDISLITFQSDEALKKSRLRLRKKFDLDRSTNLVAFIQNL